MAPLGLGREGKLSVDPNTPLYSDSGNRSPRLEGAFGAFLDSSSPRIGYTPRIAPSPRLGGPHQRRSSNSGSSIYAASPALWSKVFSSPQPSHLPTTRRPFGASPDPSGRGRASLAHPLILLRNALLRPLYVLGRRGPIVPILAFALFILFFTYSTSPSSQSVKRRMQGAVGPYIPQRAADAIKWRGKQAPWDSTFHALRNPGSWIGREEVPLAPPRKDGRMLLEEGKRHPIPALMERAKGRWKALKGRQSKTFAEAVKEYRRRYGRRPPKGFDKWYAFAKANKVLLIDEFDLIDQDLLIYRAFSPATFRARVAHLADRSFMDVTWTIRLEDGKVLREGQLANHDRAWGVAQLMESFAHQLPDMTLVYNGHDGARISITSEERTRLENLANSGQYDSDLAPPFWPKKLGPAPHWGQEIFCPADSAVREPDFFYGDPPAGATGFEMPPLVEGSVGAIIEDFSASMNMCENPQYRHFHATTSWVYGHHPTPVLPLLTPGVQKTFGDIHGLITEQLDLEQQHDPTWEERPFSSLQWRGQTSGPLWDKWMPWKGTQRARLHLLSHSEFGNRKIVLTDEEDNARVVEVPNYRLNPLFLDTGMVGPAVQCVQEDGTCDKMYEVFQGYDKRISFDRASLYKFVLDIDGNSWSGRFRRLMMSNAAVVKATLFPEFWTDWAIPWLHYIPMQVDYSDMWDILAFFRGGLNGEGAHDALAKEIALAGKEWVRECYRWEDLEAYQYRLLLEYGRLYNDETSPGSNDFRGEDLIEPEWTGKLRRDKV